MTTVKIPFKSGTTAQNDAYTGQPGEITIDRTLRSLRVHDGILAGGEKLLRLSDLASVTALQGQVDASSAALATLQTAVNASRDAAAASAASALASKNAIFGYSDAAGNAAVSATASQNSATASATSATNSATSASTSAAAAAASASLADSAGNASSALASKNAAAASATAASTSQTAAAGSATAASTSQTAAAGSATAAATSATNAATSATSASTSATSASTSAGTATTGATTATTQAGIATTGATTATTQAGNASTSATSASTSAATALGSLAGTASAAAQAANARDQANAALATLSVSLAAQEVLPSIAKVIHVGNVARSLIYDTARDSDGGAWRKRCTEKSWYNEALGGTTWLGQFVGMLAARGDNLLSYPEELDNATWVTTGTTVVANQAQAPDGSMTLDRIAETAVTSNHLVKETMAVVAGVYAMSCVMKQGERTWATLSVWDGTASHTAYFDLANGVVGATTAASSSITPTGNGAYKCVLLFTATAGSGDSNIGIASANSTNSYLGDVTKGIYAGQAKLNQVGVLPSTYSASPEMVLNGGFDVATNWVMGARWAIGSGVASSGVGASGNLITAADLGVVAGKVYAITYTLSNVSAGQIKINGGGLSSGVTAFPDGPNRTANGTYTDVLVAVGNGRLAFYDWGSFIGSIDNISLKEVTVKETPYVSYASLAGSYYQNTSDGKFYTLNATYGATEVFRGNVREFPEQVAIIGEAGRVIIYDLTQPGVPMWMVLVRTPVNGFWNDTNSLTALAAYNSSVYLGSAGGMWQMNFLNDRGQRFYSSNTAFTGAYLLALSNRNSSASYNGSGGLIVNGTVNAIALTAMDGATIALNTGLPVPTVAVATNGGVTVIQDTGAIVNSASTNQVNNVAIDAKFNLFVSNAIVSSAYSRFTSLIGLGASFALTTNTYSAPSASGYNTGVITTTKQGYAETSTGNGWLRLQLYAPNVTSPLKNMVAHIASAFNSGWQIGDSRLATLNDTIAETLAASSELVTNGTFATDVSSWTAGASGGGTIALASGAMRVTNDGTGTNFAYAYQGIPTVVGKMYVLSWTRVGGTGSGLMNIGNNAGGNQIISGSTAGTYIFVAQATTTYIAPYTGGSVANQYYDFDNISCKVLVLDASIKANGLLSYGSLTKAAVASGSQLVAFSGFSPTAYLQQPYSANLDFGTGEWDMGAWLNTVGYGPHNLLLYPEQLDNAAWAPYNAIVTANATTAPDGTTTADKLVVNSTAGVEHYIDQSIGLMTPGSYSSSIYVKDAGTATSFYLAAVASGYAAVAGVLFTISTGVVTAGAPVGFISSASAVSVGSGWYRCQINYTIGAGVSLHNLRVYPQNTGLYTGDGVSGIYLWGGQMNRGLIATNYRPGQTAVYNGLAPIFDRSAATGPSIKLGIDGTGVLTALAYDGTTTRTVSSPTAVNTGLPTIGSVTYRIDGSLAMTVNGSEVARTSGAPLLTMNNSTAVLNIGNNFTLDSPFPGSLTLACISATAPTANQASYIYNTELAMMQANAQVTLDGGASQVNALAYDDVADVVQAASTWGRNSFRDLVRVESSITSVGTPLSITANQGSHLVSGASGARYTQPSIVIRDELRRRDEATKKNLGKVPTVFDFDTISFTATTTTGATANQLTSVSVTTGTPYVGMGITGAGIPAGATIYAINGSTYTISANATAAASGVVMGQSTFNLPRGYTPKGVYSAGVWKRAGSTKDYVNATDGFVESVAFAVSPGNAVWVSLMGARNN